TDYYHSLSSYLTRLGSDPSKLFPRRAFFDQLKKFGRFGMSMAMIVLPFFTSQADDIPDMDQMAENMKEAMDKGEEVDTKLFNFTSDKTKDAYKTRMVGVFEDVYDLGYI
ncbi:CLUMA_CG001606, isoform A, partial [Clunio marinus]